MDSLIRMQIKEVYSAMSKITGSYGIWAKEHGLSYNALLVLYTIEELSKCTQKQICDRWLIPKQTVNTILADFKEQGYVAFEIDNNNKREKLIGFTELGQQYATAILTKLHTIEETVMFKMGSNMCEQLVEANNVYYDLFKKEIESKQNS